MAIRLGDNMLFFSYQVLQPFEDLGTVDVSTRVTASREGRNMFQRAHV